ncbi:MAG: tellurite-like stress resistance cysteine protease StiP [Lachnospiraceae bacterium]|nr:tellurite-like stress resistance cysteine protease StiP [Lachnospiraceae bacterium]
MQSSYSKKDVTLLLKDITGMVEPLETKQREALIQKGTHYCEMLPLEYRPSKKYIETYNTSLESYAKPTANAVCQVSEKIYKLKGENTVIVSLARAGIPIGILIKHYLDKKYNLCVPHYSISIIRDRGIDTNAIHYILSHHNAKDIQFVDGWIGKGAIQNELRLALNAYPQISTDLAVLADPANITDLCGTHEDILIPSSCLNSTVSGLISRTFLRDDIILPTDFHGAAFYPQLINEDVSYEFINAIEKYFDFSTIEKYIPRRTLGIIEVKNIVSTFGISNINFVKPGIGEATRVLLRRVPWKLLIAENCKSDPLLTHLLHLAAEKNVSTEIYPLQNYRACGIIKTMADI